MSFIEKMLNSNFLSEALNYRATKPGENIYEESDINSPHIQKMIDFYVKTTGQDKQSVLQKFQVDIDQTIEYLSKAPIMNKNAIENAASSQSFYLLDEIDLDKVDYSALGIQRKDLLNGDVFFDLTEAIIVENADFFPLKNPFEPRSIKPAFFISPDDLWMMSDAQLKASSQGDFTAFCTPTAQMVFNRKFSEKLALYSIITGPKSKSKKYKSNGGKFPDWYEYIEFVMVHELLHFSVGDHFYTKSQVEKITKKHPEISTGLAHKILNYTGDFINNHTLVNSGYAQLPIGLFSQNINYDRMKTYDEVVEAIIAEFKKLNPDEQKDMSDEMEKQMDDHTDSDDQKPSQGGGEGQPSSQDSQGQQQQQQGSQDKGQGDSQDSQDGQDGQQGQGDSQDSQDGQDGQQGQGDSSGSDSSGDSSDGSSNDSGSSGQSSSQSSNQSSSSDSKQGDDQSSKIDQAMKKAQDKMANRQDGDTSKSAKDILNQAEDGKDGIDNVTKAKKEAKAATTLLDTNSQEDFIIDWAKLLKKMIPSASTDTEETYSRMARSSTSSMVTLSQTGSGRIQPGEILMDPEKKSLLFVIDNSGSVYDTVAKFNNQIIQLLEKNKDKLDNFFVMKFSDSFDLFKVDVKKGTFQQIDESTLEKLFDKKGTKLNPKIKLNSTIKKVKTELFKHTFAGATRWKPATHFMVEAFWNTGANICLFTDDDFTSSETNEFKKFIKLANKKRGQVAMFITDKRSFDNMVKTFGKNKFMSVFQQ